MSDHMLCKGKTKSLLIPSEDTALLLYPVISSCRDLVSAPFKHVYIQQKSPKVNLN